MNKEQQKTWQTLSEPAPIIDEFGNKFWYDSKGNFHRDNDNPAIEWVDGSKQWFINGLAHRNHGRPAVINANGDKAWWIHGVKQKQYWNKIH